MIEIGDADRLALRIVPDIGRGDESGGDDSYADSPQGMEAAELLRRIRHCMSERSISQSELARSIGLIHFVDGQ